MKKREKKVFVKELIKNVQAGILEKANEWPEEWDGIELRWLVADHFSEVVIIPHTRSIQRKRKRDYNNEVLVKNLV